MSVLLEYLLSIGGFAVASLCAAVWMILRPRSIAARRTIVSIVLVYAVISVWAVPWVLSRPLLAGFHYFQRADACGRTGAIVLLGAGSFTVHGRHQRLSVLDHDAAARVLEAAYVFRLFDEAWIISSGGPTSGFDIEPGAITMRDGLVKLGIPGDRILLESTSRTTRDEAVLVAPMLDRLRPDCIVLVTTDIHMRRALATFRAAGVDAVPAITEDPLNNQSRIRSFVPTTDGLRFTSDVAHEYVGLMAYAARGWLRF